MSFSIDAASAAVNAVHNGVKAEFPAEDYSRVRCALLVYSDQMKASRHYELSQRALDEVRRLDTALDYDPAMLLQRGIG